MDQRRLREIYREPASVRLKRIDVGIGVVAIVVQLGCIFLLGRIPARTLLLLRGCVAVLAIVFVALAGVLVYRVHRDYFRRLHGK